MKTMEEKMSEMAEQLGYRNDLTSREVAKKEFKAGFRAALSLPEVQGLVDALELYAKPGAISATVEDYGQSVHLEENNDISSDCSVGAKARQALTNWKRFVGEEK